MSATGRSRARGHDLRNPRGCAHDGSMCCLLLLLAAFAPRLVLVLLWLFGGNYLSAPFTTWILPVLGFIFMPFTTLAYAFAWNQSGGSVGGVWIVLIVVAVLLDLGHMGGGARSMRKRNA